MRRRGTGVIKAKGTRERRKGPERWRLEHVQVWWSVCEEQQRSPPQAPGGLDGAERALWTTAGVPDRSCFFRRATLGNSNRARSQILSPV